jgi:hypothetical protein
VSDRPLRRLRAAAQAWRHRALALGALTAMACGADAPPPSADPPPPADTATPAAPALAPAAWPAEYGVLLLVPAPSGEGAALIPPLAPSVSMAAAVLGPVEGLDVDLFTRGGQRSIGVLGALLRTAPACPAWPQAPIAADLTWRVGVSRDVAMPIPLDSIEGFSPADSARSAVTLARLAALAAPDTASRFRGLPYAIRGAWRTQGAGAGVTYIALAARTVAVEADPGSEQVLLIAEAASLQAEPQVVFAERRSGSEQSVDIDDVLALLRFTATGRPALLLERTDARGPVLLLLERDEAGQWRERWRGPRAGC